MPGREKVRLFGWEVGGKGLEEREKDVEDGTEERWRTRRKVSGWSWRHFG